jgi:hypothetical protein
MSLIDPAAETNRQSRRISLMMPYRGGAKWLPALIALLMLLGMHAFFRDVVVPSQEADALAHGSPRGNLSDLYPGWVAARELLLHGRDPYSAEVTGYIQEGVWGRRLDKSNPNDPLDESRFAYPLYYIFVIAPVLSMPFRSVRILYMAIAVFLSAGSVLWWSRTFAVKAGAPYRAASVILFLSSYPVVLALYVQQPVLFVAGLIAGALASITAGALWAGGIMLALAMIKPQASLAIAGWLLLWALSNWKERKSLFLSFAATIAIACTASEALLPGWLWKWRTALAAYMKYAPLPPAQVELALGRNLGMAAGVALVLAVGMFCWSTRREPTHTNRFKLTAPLILTSSLVISPVWHNYDAMCLLPAVLLIAEWRDGYKHMKPMSRAIVGLSAVVLAWQWIAALSVSLISIASPKVAQELQILPWLSVFAGPILVLVSLVLVARVRLSRDTAGSVGDVEL